MKYSFSKHLLIFLHVPGIELGTGDRKIVNYGQSLLSTKCRHMEKRAIKSLFKETSKKRMIMFEDVPEKQCLLLHFPSSLNPLQLSPPWP